MAPRRSSADLPQFLVAPFGRFGRRFPRDLTRSDPRAMASYNPIEFYHQSYRMYPGTPTTALRALDPPAAVFVTTPPGSGMFGPMARPSESQADPSVGAVPPSTPRQIVQADPDLERELLRAMEEFERGDYIELTVEQLEHCAATGKSPWPDESHG